MLRLGDLKRLVGIGIVVAALILPGRVLAVEPLVTDISEHLISISSDFTGTELLLFGAIGGADEHGRGDVVVVIRGPQQRMLVRKKKKRSGIWVNTQPVTFHDVPGFYAISSSAPLEDIAAPTLLNRHQIGLEHLQIHPEANSREAVLEDPERLADYRDAVIRGLSKQGLFQQETDSMRFMSDTLFRTRISFPANVPVGTYRAEVYLIRDGHVVPGGAQSSPIFIDKVGIGRAVYNFAHRQPIIYGIVAVLLALFAGWIAAVAFRKL
jgi:uncharacterized protein (TIGR02186 family)